MTTSAYRLLIVGAGGFGREVHGWLTLDPAGIRLDGPWVFGGFLDANSNALAGFNLDAAIVGDPADFIPAPEDRLLCALGDPATKLKVCRDLKSRGAQFASFISSQALIGPRCRWGEGCVFVPHATLTADVTLGSFVMLNVISGAGHDVVMGDGCTLSGHCDVTGGARLGEGVFMGSHAAVAPGVTVGDYARIGAGSVALRDVPAYATVLGVPAKTLFQRPPPTKAQPG